MSYPQDNPGHVDLDGRERAGITDVTRGGKYVIVTFGDIGQLTSDLVFSGDDGKALRKSYADVEHPRLGWLRVYVE